MVVKELLESQWNLTETLFQKLNEEASLDFATNMKAAL